MSSKKNREGKKPSVFERLGSKPSLGTEDYCKQWAHKGTCSYSNKCKFLDTHNSKNFKPVTTSTKEGKRKSRSRSPANRKEVSTNKARSASKHSSKLADSGEWEKSLEHEDELALERKLQMLQRELAKQEEQEYKGRPKKPTARKRERSSSSSSTTSSSSSETSTETSDSSSSSSASSSSSSSSSSDSDGEVKEKKFLRKKAGRSIKQGLSNRNQEHKEKTKAKARKLAKLSPVVGATKKKECSISNKKQSRITSSPKLQHSSSSSVKHSRESPSYAMIRSRSPRIKESESLTRERRQRRSPESSPNEAKRKLSTSLSRRRVDDHSPTRARSRERKTSATISSNNTYDVRGKTEKSRDRLLEPGYLVRPRSPIGVSGYREPYPVRDISPTGPSFRERARVETYDSRHAYSPQPVLPKLERKEELYDTRSRRPASPEPLRRQISGRPKDYSDYEHDWVLSVDQAKLPEWEHSEYRRRARQVDDISWSRNTEMSWKKSYSPPPLTTHPYPESIHSGRNIAWEPLSKSATSRSDEQKRERDRRVIVDERRSRESVRRPTGHAKALTSAPTTTSRPEESHSPVPIETPLSVATKADEAEEMRPSSSAVDAEENFSDFSDDVDEILNQNLQDTDSVKSEEVVPADSEADSGKLHNEAESKDNEEPIGRAVDNQLSPKIISPVIPAIEGRSTDDDLLGGMDIEQISDEELEDETKNAYADALEVDWTSLACKREKKGEPGSTGARQRWEGKNVLARLGITTSDTKQHQSGIVADRKPMFDFSSLFQRALSARMDLTLRRSLCNLPEREILVEHCDYDMSLYKTSVELILKDRVLAN